MIASALNASVCALMNSGISQKCLIAAICIGVNEERLILNPNLDELNECTANLTFVLDNQDFKLISFLHEGSFTIDLFERALQSATDACKDVFTFYKESIKKQFNRKEINVDANNESNEMILE